MASGRNTPEYLTIVAKTEDLRLALQHDLTSIGGSLMSCGFISPDQYSKLRNRMFTESERAADLVQWIQDKVAGSARSYDTFTGVLQQDTMQYSHILSTLQQTYIQKQQANNQPQPSQAPPPSNTTPTISAASAISTEVSVAQPVVINFSPNLSDDEFMSYLKKEGLLPTDCENMKKNGIGAMTFANDLRDEDISNPQLGFTFGGKKVLRRLLREIKLSPSAGVDAMEPIDFNEDDKKQISIDGDGEKIPVEYFDPYGIDRATLHPVRFNFGVVNPKEGAKVSNVEAYDMSRFPHGIALIINNESFEGKERRTGTAVDQRHLTHAFRYLGYCVEIHREVDSQRMMAIMTEMGKRSHDEYDSFVCCILSHGTAGHVFGTDGEKVSLDMLTQKIDAQRCPSLRNKPKLFFLQACRGELRELTVAVGADSDIRPIPDEIPQTADFFFGHATPLGHVAWRDFNHGSWYVSELCHTLCEMSTYASLNDIMTTVCARVASGEKYKNIGYRMTPEVTTRLQGNVYF